MSDWQSMETAPKPELGVESPSRYVLGFIPEHIEDPLDLQSCISVVWWEPKLKGGAWWSDADMQVFPTHWMPLPSAPNIQKESSDAS